MLTILILFVITDGFAFSPYPSVPSSRLSSLLQYKTTGEDALSAMESSILDASGQSKKSPVFPSGLNKKDESNNNEDSGNENNIILLSDEKTVSPVSSEIVTPANKNTANEGELILPSTVTDKNSKESKTPKSKESKSGIFSKIKSLWRKSRQLRPSTKFRIRLGFSTIGVLLIWGQLVPWARLLVLANNWWNHRGFTGVAALGRSVTYGWVVLVAYPRMLDRRASERRRNDQQKSIEQRRAQLARLSAQVFRLRQELLDIDAEIRSFRREIISLKAYAKEEDQDVQDAIGAEMSHLAELRSSKQAALTAARQIWADVKAKSPPESWDLHDSDLLTPN